MVLFTQPLTNPLDASSGSTRYRRVACVLLTQPDFYAYPFDGQIATVPTMQPSLAFAATHPHWPTRWGYSARPLLSG